MRIYNEELGVHADLGRRVLSLGGRRLGNWGIEKAASTKKLRTLRGIGSGGAEAKGGFLQRTTV